MRTPMAARCPPTAPSARLPVSATPTPATNIRSGRPVPVPTVRRVSVSARWADWSSRSPHQPATRLEGSRRSPAGRRRGLRHGEVAPCLRASVAKSGVLF
jgi:hypothetical protein